MGTRLNDIHELRWIKWTYTIFALKIEKKSEKKVLHNREGIADLSFKGERNLLKILCFKVKNFTNNEFWHKFDQNR